MQFFQAPNVDFMGMRRWAFLISGTLVLASILLLIFKGPKYGIDFTGGTLVQIHVEGDHTVGEIRAVAMQAGLSTVEIQNFGEAREFLLKYQEDIDASELVKRMEEILGASIRVDRTEKVGPRVGHELRTQAIRAVLIGLLLMLVYIWVRFNLLFGVGAVIALFHDVLITLGVLVLFSHEITIPIVAALLTIVGYSINDSIVVSDRVRENLNRLGQSTASVSASRFVEIINRSVNETLSRTVITSLTTLIVLLALLFLGGPVLFDFALALTVGVVVGTYSSIFIVSALVAEWKVFRELRKRKGATPVKVAKVQPEPKPEPEPARVGSSSEAPAVATISPSSSGTSKRRKNRKKRKKKKK